MIAAGQELRQPVVVDAYDAILDRYRAACAAAGIAPLPDAQAAAMLAMVLACLRGDDAGLELQ